MNRPVLDQAIDTAKAKVQKVIPDHRPPIDEAYNAKVNSTIDDVLGFLLNNPVMNMFQRYNPLTVVLETIEDEIGDSIKLPDVSSLMDIVTRVIGNLLEAELDNILRLVRDIGAKIQACFEGSTSIADTAMWLLEDTLWTLIDTIKPIAMAIYDALAGVLVAGSYILTDTWKISLVTDLWTDLTDQDFSFLNPITLVIATGLNLYYLGVHGKMPFDENTDPNALFNATDDQLNLGKVLGISSSADLVARTQAVNKRTSNGFIPSKSSLKVKKGLDSHMSQLNGHAVTAKPQVQQRLLIPNGNKIVLEGHAEPKENFVTHDDALRYLKGTEGEVS